MSGRGARKNFPPTLLTLLLVALPVTVLLAPPAAAQGPEGEPIYESPEGSVREGSGFELYADGSLNIGGDVLGSCETVLETFRRTGERPTRDTYRQVEACEEFGFQVPGSESLPETGGPSLPVVATLGSILACALCLLATRRAIE